MGYVHGLSPEKKASNGNKFINFNLQMESSVVRATCFSEQHFDTLRDAAENKMLVKISSVPKFDNFYREDTIKINERDTVSLSETNNAFAFDESIIQNPVSYCSQLCKIILHYFTKMHNTINIMYDNFVMFSSCHNQLMKSLRKAMFIV